MKLSELLKNIKPTAIVGDSEREVTGIEIDSRKVAAGGLFVAMKGTQVDGHRFIEKAVEQGAVAVLCEDLPEKMPSDVTFVQVESTEEAVGPVATVFFGEPSLRLKLVGVTGTKKVMVSPTAIVASIAPGRSVRYTAELYGKPSLRRGMADFTISFAYGQYLYTVRSFQLQTGR